MQRPFFGGTISDYANAISANLSPSRLFFQRERTEPSPLSAAAAAANNNNISDCNGNGRGTESSRFANPNGSYSSHRMDASQQPLVPPSSGLPSTYSSGRYGSNLEDSNTYPFRSIGSPLADPPRQSELPIAQRRSLSVREVSVARSASSDDERPPNRMSSASPAWSTWEGWFG